MAKNAHKPPSFTKEGGFYYPKEAFIDTGIDLNHFELGPIIELKIIDGSVMSELDMEHMSGKIAGKTQGMAPSS